MRYTYDATVDCGYIYFVDDAELSDGKFPAHRTIEVKTAPRGFFGQLLVDVTPEGRVLGIEVLNVTLTLPELKEELAK